MSLVLASTNPRLTFIRDIIVATVVMVCLYGLALNVQFQWLQIPGYLLIVGFDVLEVTFGSAGANYYLLFALYLMGLGILGALLAHRLRERASERALSWWRVGVASALAMVGVLSLLFALFVLIGTSQRTPVLITIATSLILFALAGWLAGIGRK
ncbi:hypothetical protein [Haladaptatus halobius]|uniref:hypothetical protein n=1 Tax=Haladaptatus halobius TaxID=2884875 RepID=UPI001D0AA506|nr:hypothetical protein [Haladaptatus halobius]